MYIYYVVAVGYYLNSSNYYGIQVELDHEIRTKCKQLERGKHDK